MMGASRRGTRAGGLGAGLLSWRKSKRLGAMATRTRVAMWISREPQPRAAVPHSHGQAADGVFTNLCVASGRCGHGTRSRQFLYTPPQIPRGDRAPRAPRLGEADQSLRAWQVPELVCNLRGFA